MSRSIVSSRTCLRSLASSSRSAVVKPVLPFGSVSSMRDGVRLYAEEHVGEAGDRAHPVHLARRDEPRAQRPARTGHRKW